MRAPRVRRWAAEALGVALVAAAVVTAAERFANVGPVTLLAVTVVAVLACLAASVIVLRAPRAIPRRLEAYAATVAIVLSVLFTVALAYREYRGPGPLAASLGDALLTLVFVAGLAWAIFRVGLAAWIGGSWVLARPRLAWLSQPSHLSFGWILLALALLWAPALLLLAPGSTTYDGTRQLNEIIGARIPELDFTYVPSNHHPWFATLWQGALLWLGMGVSGGDINAGLLVHSVVLVAASLLTYTAVIARIRALTSRGWMLAALVFFGVIPHFANYAMLYEKTGWYQLALIWFFLGVVDVVLRRGHGGVQAAQLIAGGALAALFRSNGLYIVVPTLLVLAVVLLRRTDRARLVVTGVSAVAVLAVFFGWSSVVLPRLGVTPASPGEALVLPFQQVARIVVEHGDELTPQERETIEAVMPFDEIAGAYDPENGDGVKGLYEIDSFLITDVGIRKMQERGAWEDDETVSANRNAFLALWAQLVLRYPGTAVSATLNNTYLYFAPPLGRGDDISLFTGGLPGYFVLANEYTGDYRHTLGEEPNAALTRYYGLWASTPGLNMLVNPGLYGWIVIALGVSLAFWPRRERLMLYAPIALVYLVNFAGARNGDFRYTVPLVALLPMCLAAWFAVDRHRSASTGAPEPEPQLAQGKSR